MISYMIINAALFLSMVFIIHYYICKEPVFRDSPLKSRVVLGFSFGFVSVVLMFFRFQLESGLVDLRHLPILLAAFYGGWASAFPAWILASMGRFSLTEPLGDYSIPILILGLDALIGVILPPLIRSYRFSWYITLVATVLILLFILPDVLTIHRFDFWIVYAGAAFLGGAVAFHLIESLRGSQQTLMKLKKSQEDMEKTVHDLHEAKEQLESYITHNADGIVILDRDERIIKINPAFEKMSGWRAGEVLGRKTLPWIPAEYQEEASRFRRQTKTNGSVIGYEAVRLRKNGEPFHVSISVSTIYDRNGHVIGFSGVYRDITEQKKTDEFLRNTEKLSLVGELAAGIAHELRNPLTTLKGFIHLIKKDNPSSYLGIMDDELDRIEAITNELLYLAKPLAAERKTVPIREILEQVTLLLTPQAILHNIQLEAEIDEELPMITCNVNQIKQVFINLMKNAIEAMPSGGVIRLRVQSQGEAFVLVSVIDNGMGIPEERMEKLGQPFYSLKEKGTGLGLTICKKIVQEHNGDLSFESEMGKGTTVYVVLPYCNDGSVNISKASNPPLLQYSK
ncbi:ATP-binding protein [Ammoniphilus sp. CFH 90114]|uniref:ATP-binding protein n=1 Tax=Ammoniphilus sp. CFH 90114 TaxID=2493665 RepID=UPI0013E95B7D|nr:ATP-binding protein [Ammoniphilus sp. CFH 90114]